MLIFDEWGGYLSVSQASRSEGHAKNWVPHPDENQGGRVHKNRAGMFAKVRGKLRPVIPHLVHALGHHLLKISMFFNKNIAEIAFLAQQNGL